MKNIKKVIAVMLMITMLMPSMSVCAAVNEETIDSNLSIQQIDESTLEVKEENSVNIITIEEKDNKKTVTIKNRDTGKEEYFIYNKATGEMYSSITKETVNLNDDEQKNEIAMYSVSSYKTYKYSDYTIKRVVGKTAAASEVLAFLLGKIKKPEVKAAARILQQIAGLAVSGSELVFSDSKNHGLKVTVKITKYYRTRAGRRQVYKTTYLINSVKKY